MFKKLNLSLLTICLSLIIFGCSTVTISKDKKTESSNEKNIAANNIKSDEDVKYQKMLETLEKSRNNYFPSYNFIDTYTPENERIMAIQLYIIVYSELDKPMSARDYNFVFWYVDKYLTENTTVLKDNYNSYSELQSDVENVFPKLYNFYNQSDMNVSSYLSNNFNKLILEYYMYRYFLSLTKQQQQFIEKERTAWEKYKSAAMKFFTAFHVDYSGSIAGIFRAYYNGALDNQYLSTFLGCSFTDNNSRNVSSDKKLKSGYTFIDNFPKYLESVFADDIASKSILYAYRKIDRVENILNLSRAEIVAWNEWIKIRESYGANGFDSKTCNYEYYTEALMKMKLIDVKNLYNNHAFGDSSLEEILLKPDSSVEEILNYDFITSYKK